MSATSNASGFAGKPARTSSERSRRCCRDRPSLVKRGAFHAQSDVDLAVFELPGRVSEFAVHGMLEERIGRPVDLLLLPEHRLKDKIQREGELWII